MTSIARKVLLVDDERHIRHLVEYKLQSVGFTVLQASNGRAALEIARREKPDLIVTDFQMPEMNGLQLARKLKEDVWTAQIPLIMITSRGHRVPASELVDTEIRQLLPKPFSPREFLNCVSEILTLDLHSDGANAA
jgi:two-component system alkaline phosphatase synthesis response regulator PhoP